MVDFNNNELNLQGTPEQWAEGFRNLKTARDLASLLQVDYEILVYYLYKIPIEERYTVFQIEKRRGNGKRTICAPNKSLKIIQSKLLQVLSSIYAPKIAVHGFCPGRSILTNATSHVNQKYVLNIDLAGFFPSINFGRVRGMFIAQPYSIPEEVATVLAQVCCFKNELPQGAPTSPIVSNMICAKMDSELRILAQRNRCIYTRYADDITFSTSAPKLSSHLASIVEGEKGNSLQIGDALTSIIENNGFKINYEKVRLQTRTNRQEVTGIVTNQFPNVTRKYVRQVRAMLHSWEKFGLEKAEQEHFEKYRRISRSPYKDSTANRLSFKYIVLGKIGFIGSIRGKTDFLYIKLLNKLISLSPDLEKQKVKVSTSFETGAEPKLKIITEGQTDWMHIKAALESLKASGTYADLDIEFDEYTRDMGEAKLLSICEALCLVTLTGNTRYVCIFDRDQSKFVNKVNDGTNFKRWSDKVYSFSIQVPKHRTATPEISIEFYYQDSEIKKPDSNQRRLYINTEFLQRSGLHRTLKLVCSDTNKLNRKGVCVIDDKVYPFDKPDKNVALPKKDFATYILKKDQNFENFNFSAFKAIFNELQKIMNAN